MNQIHLGIDVSKLKLDVCLLRADSVHTAVFENNPAGFRALDKWLAGFADPVRACLESTGIYSLGVAAFLHQKQRPVSIVNPLMVHHFAKARLSRNKTDQHDAELIARFSQQNNPRLWQPLSDTRQKLQEFTRLRQQLVELAATAKHHLESAPAFAARFFKAQLRQLQGQIEKVENQARRLWQGDPELASAVAWLTSIPGAGETTAALVLSVAPPLEQIDNARQLAAFAGVTPAQKQSGNNPGKTRMSKLGHSRLRKALYLPAVAALHCNPRAKALAERLTKKGKAKMVIIGAVMRLLLHLMFGVLKNRAPFDPNHLNACSSH